MKKLCVVTSGVLLAGAVFLAGRGTAFGYAGEAGSGAGPDSVLQETLRVSTHHTHLTRALAYCAGFDAIFDQVNPVNPLVDPATAPLAEQIAIYDELTDQGTLTSGSITWNNFNKTDWSYTLPTAEQVGCDPAATMLYPVTTSPNPEVLPQASFFDPSSGWFTNRFGPWAVQFHFPLADAQATRETSEDLRQMRAFAYGQVDVLSARSVYAFGPAGTNFWSPETCYSPPRRDNLATGDKVKKGSVAAFGTYLHSLGDSYSHGYCQRRWTSTTPPWVYHTPMNEPTAVEGCGFNDHTWEFGCPDDARRAEFITGVVDGGLAVFNELLQYPHPEKKQPRLASADAYGWWLKRQLQRYAILFQINTEAEAGKCRVNFAHELMKMCKTISESPTSACFSDVNLSTTQCGDNGRTTGCTEGNQTYYPIQSPCSPPAPQSATAP